MKTIKSFRIGKYFRILSCIFCAFILFVSIFNSSVIAKAYDKDILSKETLPEGHCIGYVFDDKGEPEIYIGNWENYKGKGIAYCSRARGERKKNSFLTSLFGANSQNILQDFCLTESDTRGECYYSFMDYWGNCTIVPVGKTFEC